MHLLLKCDNCTFIVDVVHLSQISDRMQGQALAAPCSICELHS